MLSRRIWNRDLNSTAAASSAASAASAAHRPSANCTGSASSSPSTKLNPFHLANAHPPKSAPLPTTPMSATARFQLTRANAPQANWNTATAVNTCAARGMLGMCADGRRVDRAGAEGGNCGNEQGPQTMTVSRSRWGLRCSILPILVVGSDGRHRIPPAIDWQQIKASVTSRPLSPDCR